MRPGRCRRAGRPAGNPQSNGAQGLGNAVGGQEPGHPADSTRHPFEQLADALEQFLEEEPGGVGIAERVVQYIAVAVVALRVAGELNNGIGREKTAQVRVVHPPVHVDEGDAVEHLVAGVAAQGGGAGQLVHRRGRRGRAALAPGIVGQALGDDADGAQVVSVQVAGACGRAAPVCWCGFCRRPGRGHGHCSNTGSYINE